MITFNDLYQMKRKAQELGWEDRYLHWHIYEPGFNKILHEMGSRTNFVYEGKLKPPLKEGTPRSEVFGIPLTLYGPYEQGEMLGYDLILENQKIGNSDAFVLKVSSGIGIVLKKYWLLEGIA